jgi:hypothetical protein
MAQGRMTKPVPLKRNAGMLECPVCKMPLRVERVMEKLERLAPGGDGQVSLDCESCKANYQLPRKAVERMVIEKKMHDLFAGISQLVKGSSSSH